MNKIILLLSILVLGGCTRKALVDAEGAEVFSEVESNFAAFGAIQGDDNSMEQLACKTVSQIQVGEIQNLNDVARFSFARCFQVHGTGTGLDRRFSVSATDLVGAVQLLVPYRSAVVKSHVSVQWASPIRPLLQQQAHFLRAYR